MKVKVKLHGNAEMPQFAYGNGAVGADIKCISYSIVDMDGYGYIEYDTGISVQPPEGYYIEAGPRSSCSNYGLILSNSVGIIDPDYRGTIKARFKWIKGTAKYEVGDKIIQLILRRKYDFEFEQVDDLDETDRGDKGFGSSGN